MSSSEYAHFKMPSGDPFARHGARKRKRLHLKMAMQDITGLNLTAMMDMMTILLVFLVKSFTSDPSRVDVNADLRPPKTTSVERVLPAVTVTVTSKAILVDDKPVTMLAEVKQEELDQAYLPGLLTVLQTKVEEFKNIEEKHGRKFDGALLVVAHETIPYNLLTSVLYTAGQAQFSSFRLMLMKKETPVAPE